MPKNIEKTLLIKAANKLPRFENALNERLKKPQEAREFLQAAFEDYQECGDAQVLIAAISAVQKARPAKNPLQKLGYRLDLHEIRV